MRKALVCLFMLLFVAFPSVAGATIIVVDEPGTDPSLVKNTQQVADAFDTIMTREMKVSLDKDVRIFVTAGRESYSTALQRDLGQPRELADRNAKVTGGMSLASRHVVVLNGDASNVKSLGGVAMLVAHELFHQIQGQLEGDKKYRMYWMSEGTADYVGALVSDRLGVINLDGWKKLRINLLRKNPNHALPLEITELNLAQWTTLMEQKRAPYEMSDLMVFFLLEQSGGRGTEAITEYFRQCGRLQDGKRALKAAFGIEAADFSARFTPWFTAVMAQKGSMEIESSGLVSPKWLSGAKNSVSGVSALLGNKWDLQLQSSLRVILVPSANEFTNVLTRELGYAPEVAEKMRQEAWRYSRGIAIVQAAVPQSDEAREQLIAEVATRLWLVDTVSPSLTDRLYWLGNGAIFYSAAMATESRYPGFAIRQQDMWLKRLDGEIPALGDLADAPLYQATAKRLGARKTEAVCGLATMLLLEKYGPESYGKWLHNAKEMGDPRIAFSIVFGLSWEAYASEFQTWLTTRLKKAA